MEPAVLVIAGVWERSNGSGWDFVVEKEVMARCISIKDDMTFTQLKSHVETEFAEEAHMMSAKLSYWPPNQMSMLASVKTPPVTIKTDAGVQAFKQLRKESKCLNLFVTFEASNSQMSEEETNAETANQTKIIRLTEGTPSLNGEDSDGNENGVLGTYLGSTLDTQKTTRCIDLNCCVAEYDIEEQVNMGPGRLIAADDQQRTLKGKDVVINEQWSNSGEINEADPYGTDEDEEYDYEFWEDFIRAEEDMEPRVTPFEIGETSKAAGPCSVTQLDNGGNVLREFSEATEEDFEQRLTNVELGETSKSREACSVLQRCNDEAVPIELFADAQDVDRNERTQIVETNNEQSRLSSVQKESNLKGGSETGVEQQNDAEMQKAIALTQNMMDNETNELIIVATNDVPPCFDTGYEATQDIRPRQFDDKNDSIYIGRVFRNKSEMQTALAIYAIKRLFLFRQVRSDPERLIVCCVDRRCAWRVYGHTVGGQSENIEVRTATLTHTCDITTRAQYGKKASAKVIAEVLKTKYTNGKTGPRAMDIPEMVLEELRVNISYMKAWRAKEKAVMTARGSDEGSYKLLLTYLHLLKEANPGTVYNVRSQMGRNGTERFKYMFLAMGACVEGAKYCRKVIIIDATTIKSKFKGCMMTASVQDGNFQILPIGFGVVDGENEAAWTWFFIQLIEIVPDASDLVFVSDRHSAIYAALRRVYPVAQHGACCVHLYRNIKSRFKSASLAYLVTLAARAYSVGEFREHFTEIEKRNPKCAKYLQGIGISHWTQAYFEGRRYNLMSSNVSECLNAALAKALEYPIVSMVEAIRMMLMRWFYVRRAKAERQESDITEEVEKLLQKHLVEASGFSVAPASYWIYQVNRSDGASFTVDLECGTCSCKMFNKLLIPCSHAIAASKVKQIPITSLVSDYYKVETWKRVYKGIIMPVPNAANENVPEEVKKYELGHPPASRPSGRPRKRRIPSTGEDKTTTKKGRRGPNRCTRCLQIGHNRKTCDLPVN